MRLPGPTIIASICLCGVAAGQAPTPLTQLIAEADRNSPRIHAAEQAWRAAAAGVAPSAALPDPQITIQQMSVGSPLPFAGYESSNFAYTGVAVSHAIPYPGKLQLQSSMAKSNALALRGQWEQVRRTVTQQVTAAYVQLSYLNQVLTILDQQRSLLSQVEQLAELRYRTAQGSQAGVLAAQLEQTELLRDLVTYQNQRQSAQAQLRAWLNRPPTAPPIDPTPLEETHLKQNDELILAALPTVDPALSAQQARIEGADEAMAMAHKNSEPDFNVQYMYQRTGPGFPDYYQWTLGMTMPFFHRSSRQAPELERAVDERVSAQATYQDLLQQERYTVTDALLAAHGDEQILHIDRDGLLPQVTAELAASLTAYTDGREDLNGYLAAWRQALASQEQYWRTLAEHETTLSKIEELTGVGHE